MEGLLDFALRDTLTRVRWPADAAPAQGVALPHPSGLDHCVAEFIRISDRVLPPRSFVRVMPELLNGGYTASGVPVRGQLLGSDPEMMAANAQRLAALGSHGVDLNFGCPAQVVNRHGGGASLLKEPDRVYAVAHAVRQAVPSKVLVSAKMRLGFDDDRLAEDCALALVGAGVAEIVVHARTKAHGYRPPAYWARVADLRAVIPAHIPVIVNGEIWCDADARRAQAASGCRDVMLGRGMVADPGLALAIRGHLEQKSHQAPTLKEKIAIPQQGLESVGSRVSACQPAHLDALALPPAVLPWAEVLSLLPGFWQWVTQRVERRHRAGRLKQWLNLLRRRYPEAQVAFDGLRLSNDHRLVEAWLHAQVEHSDEERGLDFKMQHMKTHGT
jgi:tRNA-dihydrouridine synthase C